MAALPQLRRALAASSPSSRTPRAAPAADPPRWRRPRRGHRASSSARPARPAPPSWRCSRPPPLPRAQPPPTTGSAARAPGCWPCRRTTSPASRCCCGAWRPAPSPASSTSRTASPPDAFVDAARGASTATGATPPSCPPSSCGCCRTRHATAALAGFDAVLVGGAASPPALLARAREAGVPVVTTYGMSETCGGCVYDGIPLSCTEIRVDDDGRHPCSAATPSPRATSAGPDLTAAAFSIDDEDAGGSAPTTSATATSRALARRRPPRRPHHDRWPQGRASSRRGGPDQHSRHRGGGGRGRRPTTTGARSSAPPSSFARDAGARPRGTHGGRAARAAARHTPGARPAPTAPGAARDPPARTGQGGPGGGR